MFLLLLEKVAKKGFFEVNFMFGQTCNGCPWFLARMLSKLSRESLNHDLKFNNYFKYPMKICQEFFFLPILEAFSEVKSSQTRLFKFVFKIWGIWVVWWTKQKCATEKFCRRDTLSVHYAYVGWEIFKRGYKIRNVFG